MQKLLLIFFSIFFFCAAAFADDSPADKEQIYVYVCGHVNQPGVKILGKFLSSETVYIPMNNSRSN